MDAEEHTEQGIRAFVAHFLDAFARLDRAAFRRCFAPDAAVFHPDNPESASLHRQDGWAQVEASFQPVFEAARRSGSGPPYLQIEPVNLRVQRLNGVAVVSFEFARGGGSFGRRTLVLEERADGWVIVHLHASNAAPGRA